MRVKWLGPESVVEGALRRHGEECEMSDACGTEMVRRGFAAHAGAKVAATGPSWGKPSAKADEVE